MKPLADYDLMAPATQACPYEFYARLRREARAAAALALVLSGLVILLLGASGALLAMSRDWSGVLEVIGAVGISGDASDIDEQCAVRALEAMRLQADPGV